MKKDHTPYSLPQPRARLLSLALLGALCLTSLSEAAGLPAVSTSVGAGTSITGNCTSTGDVATPQNLSNASNNLNSAMQAAGQAITSAQSSQTSQFNNDLTALIQQETVAMQKFVSAYEAAKYVNDVSGPNATPITGASALPQGCTMQSLASSYANGQTLAQSTQTAMTVAVTRSTAPVLNHATAVNAAAAAASDAISASSLIPVGSAPVTQSSAQAYVAMAVTPVPPSSVPASMASTPAGTAALAHINTLTARQSLAAEAMLYVAQQNIPTIDAAQAQTMWTSAGMLGSPPGVSNGKISPNGLMTVLVDARYANPTYYTALRAGGEAYALRSYAYELSAQIQMQQQQIGMLQRIVALNAAMLGARAGKATEALQTLRANAISQQVNP